MIFLGRQGRKAQLRCDPPMLSQEGRQYMEAAPHLAVWPGLALTVTVYSLNMLGDAVRDLLDPRLIGGAGRLGAQDTRSV